MIQQLLYVDPGSGSYLIQAIVAAVLGVAFFFRNIMLVVRHFFSRIFGKKNRED